MKYWKLPPSSQEPRKVTRKNQKIRLKSLNPRLRNFPRKVLRTEGKGGRGMTLTLRKTHVLSNVQSINPEEAHSVLTTPKSVDLLLDIRGIKRM